MTKIVVLAIISFVLTALSGCSTWEKLDMTEKGAITGGALGSGLGAIVGNQSGSPGAGVAIGGAAGAIGGGLIGRGMETSRRSCPAGQYYDPDRNACLFEGRARMPRCPAGQYYDYEHGVCYYN